MFTAAPLIVMVFQMETASAARLGFAVVYSATPDSVRVFQMDILFAMFTAAPLTCQGVPDGNR